MTDHTLYFTGECAVEHRPVEVGDPDPDEVVVESRLSAISAGTELLVYRGEVPEDIPIDEGLSAFDGSFSFPVPYGYAVVGEVVDVGEAVGADWLGRRVFAFEPHRTRFRVSPGSLVAIPDGVSATEAALLPTVETATNLTLDAAPRLGERVVVFGAGVVGLWTIRLLSGFPLERLVAVEPIAGRRRLAERMGADAAIPPEAAAERVDDADLAVELSGSPAALDGAIASVGYDGRVVVGSWYGTKGAPVDLGGRFHRDRIDVVSSQVSTIDPALRGRWDADRRLGVALDWLERVDAEALVSHRIPFEDAATAYELLADRPEEALQVLLTYE